MLNDPMSFDSLFPPEHGSIRVKNSDLAHMSDLMKRYPPETYQDYLEIIDEVWPGISLDDFDKMAEQLEMDTTPPRKIDDNG